MEEKIKIFIGSSVEGLNVAYAVQQNLMHDAEITVWNQGVFELSKTTIESLMDTLNNSDFGIFVFSPDDIIKIRTKRYQTVRDNVVFELGLFIGKLGRERAFIVMPNEPVFHIPTDLLGITIGKYDAKRSDGSIEAATGPVSHQIRSLIKKLGFLPITASQNSMEKPEALPKVTETSAGDWFQLFLENQYDAAISSLENEIKKTPDNEVKKKLEYWKLYCWMQKSFTEGDKVIKQYVLQNGNDLFTYSEIPKIYLYQDHLDYANELIEIGLTKFPNQNSLLEGKAAYFQRIGKLQESIEILENIVSDENIELTIHLTELLEQIGEKEKAIQLIKKTYRKNPTNEQVIFRFARLAQENESQKVALFLFQKLTVSFPENDTYWGYFGNACLTLDLIDSAFIAYTKADELAKNSQDWIISNIGNLLKNQQLFEEAKKFFQKSLELNPNSDFCHERISLTLKLQEQERNKLQSLNIEGKKEVLG